MKPLIVGIDPGTTSAAAGIGFDGELEFLFSERHISTSELIERIIENGKPVIITSDKAKTPSKVSKLASSLGAKIYEPDRDLSQEEKADLGSGENYHEIDASAAAFNAFNNSRKEVRKIKQIASSVDLDLVEASRVYYGDFRPQKEDHDEENEVKADETDNNESMEARLRRKIDRLEAEKEKLEEEREEALEEKSEALDRLEDLREKSREELESDELRKKDAIITRKDREIERLQSLVETSRKIIGAYREGVQMLFEGSELLPIADEIDDLDERAAFRSEEVREMDGIEDIQLWDVEEIKGIELKDFVIAEELPEKNFEDIIREYKDSR